MEHFADARTAAEVTGSIDFASTDGAGIFAELGICYEPVGGSTVTDVALVAPEFTAPTDSYFAQTVSGVVANLAPGDYLVGTCTQDESANVLHGAGTVTLTLAQTAGGSPAAPPATSLGAQRAVPSR